MIQNKHYIFLLILIAFFLIIMKIFQEYKNHHDQVDSLYSNPFNNLKFENHLFDLSHFNYAGKCGEIFKYEPNNEQDLILYYMSFSSEEDWLRIRDDTLKILEMSYAVMKNCKRILLMSSDEPNESFVNEIQQYGIEIIKPDFSFPYGSSVVRRLFAEKIFLQLNHEKFKRIIIADFRDIIFFNDAFATFNETDLVVTMQCRALHSPESCDTLAEEWNYLWMQRAHGIEIANQMKELNGTVINGGLFLGGIDKIIELLTIQTENLDPDKYYDWGVDQATLNYIHMTGKLDHLNISKDYCSQRVCYSEQWTGRYNRNRKSVISTPTGCSPVVRHKLQLSNPYLDFPHKRSLSEIHMWRYTAIKKVKEWVKKIKEKWNL